MKYIIKNCPCIKHYDEIELDNRCMSDQYIHFFCKNITDCVIKQVIEKCKYAISHYSNLRILSTMAEQILQLFDIEVQNEQ